MSRRDREVEAESLIRCRACGAALAAQVGGQQIVRHQKREWVGFAVSIACGCGAVWINPALAVQAAASPVCDGHRDLTPAGSAEVRGTP